MGVWVSIGIKIKKMMEVGTEISLLLIRTLPILRQI